MRKPGGSDGGHVHDRGQVGHVRRHVVVAPGARLRLLPGDAPHDLQPRDEQAVGLVLDGTRDVGVGRAAGGRVVLEATVGRRVVGRRDDDAIGQPGAASVVPGQDGVGDARRRREAVGAVDAHIHAVGDQHLERGPEGRLRECVGVAAHEQRPIDALPPAVGTDGGRGGHDVVLVE